MVEADLKPQVSVTDEKVQGDVTQVNTASIALAAAVAEQKPNLLSPNMIKLYMIMGIGYLVSTMNGFDSSLMGAINAMKPYQETFDLKGAGSTTGIIFIIYNLGQIASFPCKKPSRAIPLSLRGIVADQVTRLVCGLLADGWGRRICIFVSCPLQAPAPSATSFV